MKLMLIGSPPSTLPSVHSIVPRWTFVAVDVGAEPVVLAVEPLPHVVVRCVVGRDAAFCHALRPAGVVDLVRTKTVGVPQVAVEVGEPAAVVEPEALDQVHLRAAVPLVA
jgi:hypothetical protein